MPCFSSLSGERDWERENRIRSKLYSAGEGVGPWGMRRAVHGREADPAVPQTGKICTDSEQEGLSEGGPGVNWAG